MANNILSAFSTKAMKIFDDKTSQIRLRSLSILSVDVISQADVARLPQTEIPLVPGDVFEKRAAIDLYPNKVVNPAEMRIEAIATDSITVNNAINIFLNTQTTISIISRSIIAQNMAIEKLVIEQSFEKLSATNLSFVVKQVEIPKPSTYSPKQDADQGVFGIGVASPRSLTDSVSSLYNRTKLSLGV